MDEVFSVKTPTLLTIEKVPKIGYYCPPAILKLPSHEPMKYNAFTHYFQEWEAKIVSYLSKLLIQYFFGQLLSGMVSL